MRPFGFTKLSCFRLFKEHDALHVTVTNEMDGSTNCLDRGPCYIHYDPNNPCSPNSFLKEPRTLNIELPSECVCGLAKRTDILGDSFDPFNFMEGLKDLPSPRVINGVETQVCNNKWLLNITRLQTIYKIWSKVM